MNINDYVNFDHRSQKLFNALPKEAMSYIDVRRFNKGEYLFTIGDAADAVYIILEGVCSLLRVNDESEYPQITSQIGYLDVVGLAEIIRKAPRVGSVNAFTDSVVAVLGRELVEAWTNEYPRFVLELYANVVERLFLESDYKSLCTKYSIYCNVISFLIIKRSLLIKKTPDFSGAVKIDFTREMIADTIAGDIRSVGRAIKQLRDEGLVTIYKKKIFVDEKQEKQMIEIQTNIAGGYRRTAFL